ncbi:MAG: DeoR/GlpR family DNA-binding transcription regulator [Ruminococcus sp.]
MLTQERHREILRILSEKQAVTVSELSELLNTSESTIRRDLNKLDSQGKLIKVFGGATTSSQILEAKDDTVDTRSQLNIEEKRMIGQYAATLINNYDLVYIDAGTTTRVFIEYITNKNATYVTNALDHGRYLMEKGFNVYIIGGKLKASTECVVGVDGVEFLQKFNFTKSFLGTNGVDINIGYTTPDIEEGHIKNEVVKRSYHSFILADSSKFRKVYPVTFGKLKESCIITGKLMDKSFGKETVVKEVLE